MHFGSHRLSSSRSFGSFCTSSCRITRPENTMTPENLSRSMKLRCESVHDLSLFNCRQHVFTKHRRLLRFFYISQYQKMYRMKYNSTFTPGPSGPLWTRDLPELSNSCHDNGFCRTNRTFQRSQHDRRRRSESLGLLQTPRRCHFSNPSILVLAGQSLGKIVPASSFASMPKITACITIFSCSWSISRLPVVLLRMLSVWRLVGSTARTRPMECGWSKAWRASLVSLRPWKRKMSCG